MSQKNKPSYFWITLVVLVGVLLVVSRIYRSAQFRVQQKNTLNHETETLVSDSAVEKTKTVMQKESDYTTLFSKELLLGKKSQSQNKMLIPIEVRYASREGMYIHAQAYDAFKEMHAHAQKEGISIRIISAYRSFDHQKRIWENKWHGRQILHGDIYATQIEDPKERTLEILRFSAMPGTSRHHWGTDLDFNSLNNAYFETGIGKKLFEWLEAHAHQYGFCRPYTAHGEGRTSGYEEEKWHWSYLPVSGPKLEAYTKIVDYEDIQGFAGWEQAQNIQIINRYVKDINKDCLIH